MCPVNVVSQCSDGTKQSKGWVCLLRGQRLQAHHLVFERSSGNLGHIAGLGRGLRIIWESTGPNCRHESSTDNACRSPTLLMEASASRSRVFIERNFGSTVCKGLDGPCCSALSTRDRSQEGIEGGGGGGAWGVEDSAFLPP